jgi:hypothetical protein
MCTDVRGISESPNASRKAALSIAEDGDPVTGFSQRTVSTNRSDVVVMRVPPCSTGTAIAARFLSRAIRPRRSPDRLAHIG